MELLKLAEQKYLKKNIPPFGPGDTVSVYLKVKEGGKERVQVFRGVVISRRGSGLGESFIVRKISFGVGVERVIPLHSPSIDSIEVETRGNVRRAKLYFLRKLRGRKSRLKIFEEFIAPTEEEKEAMVAEALSTPAAAEIPQKEKEEPKKSVTKRNKKADKPAKK
ncbi:MAG: 50S ribosomal protein L19 [Deltaproteobacteria bacterium RIFCSPHIGHO2_12_FULL_43_9]|nr:MAG: 50S ribosomal protein L19 [Deltaproteobacteria bacterium RIFCSPHIGHO2_12_FULL_43_9]